MECDLSVLLIYPMIFLRVFIVYRLLLGFLFVCLFVFCYIHVCVSCFGFSCQYLPSDWL